MNRAMVTLGAIVLLAASRLYADYTVKERGSWPDSWPMELDSLRKQSRTLEGPLRPFRHYAIPFTDREMFEAAWPAILSVKSPGAPLVIRRGPSFWLGRGAKAGVCIHTPPEGQEPVADARQVGRRWEKISIELIVDGDIVDLNRVPLPSETPIVDERFKAGDASWAQSEASPPNSTNADRTASSRRAAESGPVQAEPKAAHGAVQASPLEGQWQSESIDGRTVPKPVTVVFADGEVSGLFRLVDAEIQGDGSVRESRELKTSFDYRTFRRGELNAIDIDVHGERSTTRRGIYKIEGNQLIVAFQPKLDARAVSPWVDKQGRPTTLDPRRVVLHVFRRSGAAVEGESRKERR